MSNERYTKAGIHLHIIRLRRIRPPIYCEKRRCKRIAKSPLFTTIPVNSMMWISRWEYPGFPIELAPNLHINYSQEKYTGGKRI
jgi:hypothetical protein